MNAVSQFLAIALSSALLTPSTAAAPRIRSSPPAPAITTQALACAANFHTHRRITKTPLHSPQTLVRSWYYVRNLAWAERPLLLTLSFSLASLTQSEIAPRILTAGGWVTAPIAALVLSLPYIRLHPSEFRTKALHLSVALMIGYTAILSLAYATSPHGTYSWLRIVGVMALCADTVFHLHRNQQAAPEIKRESVMVLHHKLEQYPSRDFQTVIRLWITHHLSLSSEKMATLKLLNQANLMMGLEQSLGSLLREQLTTQLNELPHERWRQRPSMLIQPENPFEHLSSQSGPAQYLRLQGHSHIRIILQDVALLPWLLTVLTLMEAPYAPAWVIDQLLLVAPIILHLRIQGLIWKWGHTQFSRQLNRQLGTTINSGRTETSTTANSLQNLSRTLKGVLRSIRRTDPGTGPGTPSNVIPMPSADERRQRLARQKKNGPSIWSTLPPLKYWMAILIAAPAPFIAYIAYDEILRRLGGTMTALLAGLFAACALMTGLLYKTVRRPAASQSKLKLLKPSA